MHCRAHLARCIGRIFPLVVHQIPLGSMALYHWFGLMGFEPRQSVKRNPGKRLYRGKLLIIEKAAE